MAVRQYVGARYVPKFYEFNNGVWQSNTEYEPLTIVQYNGNSYTSKKSVPANIGNPSENANYWVVTGNYNAQVEGYRQETQEYKENVIEFKDNVNTRIDGVDTRVDGVDTRIDGVDTRIDALTQALNPEVYGSELVVLGDSFTQGYLSGGGYANPNMANIIANELGLNLHNYGVNASGYTLEGNTFQSQAQKAIADTSYDHSKVKYVLVIGGINDANADGFPNCSQASKILQSTLASAFVNATIFIIPNWGAVGLDIHHMEVFRSICEVANNNSRVTFLYDNLKSLIPYYNLMGADNVHPTQEGYYIMAKSITAMILGGHLPRSEKITATAGSGWDISGLNVIRGEDDFIIYGYFRATADITPDKMTIAVLPPESGCTASGSYIECTSSNMNNYPIRIEVGLALKGLGEDGFIALANDRGNTIHAGDSIAINFRLPILYM